MKVTFGHFGQTTVEVTNRQKTVEYEILTGNASKQEVRAAVGNCNRSLYSNYFDGWHFHRKEAIGRMECDLNEARELVNRLEFSIKVTKKKTWVKVEQKEL